MLVTGLPSNWTSSQVFQGDLGLYPGSMTSDSAGNIYLSDSGTKTIKKLSTDGSITTLVDLSNVSMNGNLSNIAWQESHQRLLISTTKSGLYAYSNGQVSTLKMSGVMAGDMAVNPTDGSFYTAYQLDGASIIHYDANGNSIGTVVQSSRGPSQFAFDAANNKLYYSETYAGRISVLNIGDGTVSTVADGIGIAGTFEPISVAFDGSGNLYTFPAATGLYQINGSQLSLVTSSIGGAGQIVWSPSREAFVQTQGAGANLISYPVDGSTQASNITPYVNGNAIGQLSDGRVILWVEASGKLVEVTSNGYVDFGSDTISEVNDYVADSNGNLFAATFGKIVKVNLDGTLTTQLEYEDGTIVVNLAYDHSDGGIAYVTRHGATPNIVTIRKLSTDGQTNDIAAITTNSYTFPLASDSSGNLYYLERGENVIYRIAQGSTSIEIWAQNVLDSDAITVPSLAYIESQNALMVSTISNYELWPLAGGAKQVFATNDGAVDNFATFEASDGDIVAIHSGEIFRMMIDTYTGTDDADQITGGSSNGSFTLGAGNDVVTAGGGNDNISGGTGIDTAQYSGMKENFTITQTSTGFSITDTVGSAGTDMLIDIERVEFSDTKVALDLSGNAGKTAKILGAVFGSDSVSNKQYAGIGLHFLDSGVSYETLMDLALNAALGDDANDHASVVKLLYKNVLSVDASDSDAEPFIQLLDDGMTKGALGVMAAETSYNTENIDLVGLQETGLAYELFAG